jgi:hypothetical protein
VSQERTSKCAWCGGTFRAGSTVGRPAKYCKRSHRQRAFEASQRGRERGLGEGEILVDGGDWVNLRDALYRLESAAEDAELDLDDGVDPRSIVAALLSASTQVVSSFPEPIATSNREEVSPET